VAAVATNPADALLDVMALLEPQALVDAFADSAACARQQRVLAALAPTATAPAPTAHAAAADREEAAALARLVAARGKHTAPWGAQLKHLSARALRNTLRNPFPFVLHGVTAMVAAVALGIVFRDIHRLDQETAGLQDRFGIMFFLLVYLSLLSLTSLPLWREDQLLFVAERGSGIYSTSPYVLATILFDVLPYRLLPPFIFTAVSYPLVNLNDLPGKQANFLASLACCNLAVSGACMLVGVLTNTNASANAAGSLLMLTSILFCGFLLNTQRTPEAFRWLVWWSPGSYA
jgi:ATP-binding cassette subfamily G (WHITE) protein 2